MWHNIYMEDPSFISIVAEGIIYVSLLVGTIYTLIVSYHWFQYGSSRKTSTTALIIFLSGSGLLFLGLVTSFYLF